MKTFIKNAAKHLAIGAAGGTICAAVILSFGGLIGRSGDTGSEYVGYWSPAYLVLALFYGSLVGMIFYPIGRELFLSGFSSRELFIAAGKIAIITIVFGCIGAFRNQFAALLFGILGFYAGCFLFRNRKE
ncbi:MAG: hypothetical protein WCH99_16290 [Verrucomicrobiota bacterium]